MALRQETRCLVVGFHVDRTPRVSSPPEQANGGNKGSVKEAGNDLRACTMSAEIPLDADGSHPGQAPESRVRASNMSHTLSETTRMRKRETEKREGRDSFRQIQLQVEAGRQENSRGQGECERGCGCIQGEGRVTRALSTTITPPYIHDSALGLPSQLLGQLSNQVSRLFLRPPWSIVPSPRLVCGPQLWPNDVISDPKAGTVSRRKHRAGGGGAPTGDNEPEPEKIPKACGKQFEHVTVREDLESTKKEKYKSSSRHLGGKHRPLGLLWILFGGPLWKTGSMNEAWLLF
ncbi:unnamed protein product [Leuciscus chuanchicus]